MNASKLVKIGNYVINPEYIAAITCIAIRNASISELVRHYSIKELKDMGFKPTYYRFVGCSWDEARAYCKKNPKTAFLSRGTAGYVDCDPANPKNECWDRERGFCYDENKKRVVEYMNDNYGVPKEKLDEPVLYAVHMAVADGGINHDHMKFIVTIAEHKELMRSLGLADENQPEQV